MATRRRKTPANHPAIEARKRAERSKPRRRFGSMAYDDMDHLNVVDKDPAYHYVWANPGGFGRFSAAWYERLGYKTVQVEKDGPRPAAAVVGRNAKSGDDVVVDDYVLMCISKRDDDAPADLASIEEYGSDGGSGQAYVDVIEAKLRHGNVGDSEIHGFEGVDVDMDISELQRDYG